MGYSPGLNACQLRRFCDKLRAGLSGECVMTRSKSSAHSVARRAAMASMTVLAASGIGLVAAPMAFGQIVIPIGGPIGLSSQSAGVTNSGSASANSGGNTAVGNGSTNTAAASAPGSSAVGVPVSLGAPTNTSEGTATVTSGPAAAIGNSAQTGTTQSNASGNQVNGFLSAQDQSAGVTNSGSGSANTGGNTAIGNNSRNSATVTQGVSGGLVGVGATLGGPVNNSTGTSTINTGAANALGNNSATNVGQGIVQGGGGGFGGGPVVGGAGVGGAGGGPAGGVLVGPGPGAIGGPGVGAVRGIGGAGAGPAPCSNGRFVSFQDVNVRNQGQAQANTGNNTAIGNNSTNNASADVAGAGQTVSGGLVGVGVTIGGPVNNSSGSAVINTGPASAIGNNSTTQVNQFEGCPQVVTVAGRPGVPVPVAARGIAQGTLARTGLDTGDLGMIAGALVGAGMLLVASQRRRLAARAAAVPMSGLGLGLGGDDWDRAVR